MMHKLRNVMGKRYDNYELTGSVEIDDGFFSTQIAEEEKDKPLKKRSWKSKKNGSFSDGTK